MADRPFNDKSFQQYLNEDKLMGSRCKKCGALYAPPRPLCVKCHSTDMDWVQMNGKGCLAAFTGIYVGPPYMIAEGFDRQHPYVSGVVELDEKVRVDARIEGVDANKPETIKVGMPLKVKFQHKGEGDQAKTVLIFTP